MSKYKLKYLRYCKNNDSVDATYENDMIINYPQGAIIKDTIDDEDFSQIVTQESREFFWEDTING